jgi:preprotein translocase SecF subunit
MGVSLIAMIVYMWYRFELGFGMGAVAALFHDVLVTAGICHLLGVQMSMTVMAALMTIVGYSVNDTIVIFDRIREDLRLYRGGRPFVDICNQSMNETLSRTLLTNFLTFVSVLCLLVFGGGAIRDFSIAMFIGMISGTYSTVYIATPVVLLWYRFKTPDLGSSASK